MNKFAHRTRLGGKLTVAGAIRKPAGDERGGSVCGPWAFGAQGHQPDNEVSPLSIGQEIEAVGLPNGPKMVPKTKKGSRS